MSQDNFDAQLQSILQGTVPFIYTAELKKSLNKGQDIILLDTRNPKEFEVSHIKNAEFIDYNNFENSTVKELAKNKTVVVYCSVGYRSEKIGEKLMDMGFGKVYNLYGGIFDWKNKGNRVVNSRGITTDSVHTYNKMWSKWLINGVKVY